jgi:DNA-directed RNA polymerase I, II, and III subunit RPABC1
LIFIYSYIIKDKMSSNNLITFNVFKNVIIMMQTRGFDTTIYDDVLTASLEDFEDVFTNAILVNPTRLRKNLIEKNRTSIRSMCSTVFDHATNPNERCIVFFVESSGDSKAIACSELTIFADIYLSERLPPSRGATTGIIITNRTLSSPSALRLTELQTSPTMFIQHFLDDELLYNPTECIWGSPTTVMNIPDTKKFLQKHKILPRQMPKITIDDPIAKYYGIRPNQLVILHRYTFIPDSIMKNELFYRLSYYKAADNRTTKGKKIVKKNVS